MNSERQPVLSSLRTLRVLCVSAVSFFLALHASSNPPARGPQEAGPFRGQSQKEADGKSSISIAPSAAPNSPEYNSAEQKAHVQPRDPSFKNRSALPERTYTKWLAESAEFIKFVNPGDLRVAPETCGASGCHAAETRAVSTSMMTHAGGNGARLGSV